MKNIMVIDNEDMKNNLVIDNENMKNILVIIKVDMKNILVIDRERGGTLVMYVLQNVGRRKGRRCALCVSARSTAPELVRQPIEHQSAHTGH